MFAKQLKTKAINRRNLRMMDQCCLSFQVSVTRIRLQSLFQRLSDSLTHLSRSCIGESHDQQTVNIHRMIRIRHHLDDPLYQNRSFTTACCCRYQKVTATSINDLLLFRCPCHARHLPHLLHVLLRSSPRSDLLSMT